MTASRCCWACWFKKLLVVLASLCVVATGGCSKPKPERIVCDPEPGPPTADQAVRNVLDGLQRHDLQALWIFLPPSYRSDVENLAHQFGERLDERTWEPFAATCRKSREVVSQLIKKFERDEPEMDGPDRELMARLRDIERLLFAIHKSDLQSVARLRSLDGGGVLSQVSHALQAAAALRVLDGAEPKSDPFSMLGDVKVEMVESTGDSAVLTVQWPGQDPIQHQFVRVEEHWIPQTLAEAWPTEFPNVREQCLAWADGLRSNPEPWHARLREIDGLLDELAATKSLAEARQVWQTGALHFAVEWFGAIPVESPKVEEIPAESPSTAKPARVKRPDTEVLLPDEPQK